MEKEAVRPLSLSCPSDMSVCGAEAKLETEYRPLDDTLLFYEAFREASFLLLLPLGKRG